MMSSTTLSRPSTNSVQHPSAKSHVLCSEKLNVRNTKQICDMEQNKCPHHLKAPPLREREKEREREREGGARKIRKGKGSSNGRKESKSKIQKYLYKRERE